MLIIKKSQMSLQENLLSFEFSLFLDDHTSKLHSKRRFSENHLNPFFFTKPQRSPLKTSKKKNSCSIETALESKDKFSLSNFYPRFERFTSNEELFSFTSLNEFNFEKNDDEVFLDIFKKKFYEKITCDIKELISNKSF